MLYWEVLLLVFVLVAIIRLNIELQKSSNILQPWPSAHVPALHAEVAPERVDSGGFLVHRLKLW